MLQDASSAEKKSVCECQEVDADTCGIWGDQLLLKLLGISSASEDFNQKARFHHRV